MESNKCYLICKTRGCRQFNAGLERSTLKDNYDQNKALEFVYFERVFIYMALIKITYKKKLRLKLKKKTLSYIQQKMNVGSSKIKVRKINFKS